MTNKQRVQEINTRNNPEEIAKYLDWLRTGGIKYRGQPVIFDYESMFRFLNRCDPRIDRERYEEMCQMADTVSER